MMKFLPWQPLHDQRAGRILRLEINMFMREGYPKCSLGSLELRFVTDL